MYWLVSAMRHACVHERRTRNGPSRAFVEEILVKTRLKSYSVPGPGLQHNYCWTVDCIAQ